ncbi:MAG: hypothetical protein QOI45_1827, partial [Thermoleophilaceae bacterium]|nr:hypothetical protein [Thermoleophilaceae bacterium]
MGPARLALTGVTFPLKYKENVT